MLEKDFNSLVVKSLNVSGYGYKIPDTFSTTGERAKAPFDGFGYFTDYKGIGHPVYFESKYLPQPKSFPIDRFEPHQEENLKKAYTILGENAIAVLLICVAFSIRDKRIYYWKNADLEEFTVRRAERRNITKKDFENRDNFIVLKKGYVDFDAILYGNSIERSMNE